MLEQEIWRSVLGFENHYEVSDQGRVRSLHFDLPRILKQTLNTSGYLSLTLCTADVRKVRTVHSVVLETFSGPRPPGVKATRHLNGDRHDNRLSNLKWGTAAENYADTVDHGRSPRGSRNGRAKLNETDVFEIRLAYRRGTDLSILADKYGITRVAIVYAVSGRTWRHV